MKAATNAINMIFIDFVISIHAAREGGDFEVLNKPCNYHISIHAAREGGDVNAMYILLAMKRFQSTPPVKAATRHGSSGAFFEIISIHAAREGGDR